MNLQYSKKVTERFLNIMKNSELSMTDELTIVEEILKKYSPKTISEFAKLNNMTYNGVKLRIDTGREMNFKIDSVDFVV